MTDTRFSGVFTQQEALPADAIAAAVDVMQSGRLHRYNSLNGEATETELLETEFAAYQGCRFALACGSGGAAMQIALRALQRKPGSVVLTNAFTLAPVPGAIAACGLTAVLVETTPELVLDVDDLARKAAFTPGAVLLLSHMRGHLSDMDAILEVVARHNLILIEDCAHTMGASWKGRMSGTHGLAGCFSTQTYKHINSGEGGFLTSDDPEFMARAVMLSGSYMLFDRHRAAPDAEVFADIKLETPNTSSRMDNLRAAILRPQLRHLDENVDRWNALYEAVADELSRSNSIRLPQRDGWGKFVGSSIQFFLDGIDQDAASAFVARCGARGVELKWFGASDPKGYTSNHSSWRYLEAQNLPQTDALMAGLFDMRLPLTFSIEDCRLIGSIIRDCAALGDPS